MFFIFLGNHNIWSHFLDFVLECFNCFNSLVPLSLLLRHYVGCRLSIKSNGNCEAKNSRHKIIHCVKSVRIRSYSGPHFPAFGLNTERYGVSLHSQSKCGKMRTRVTLNLDTFYAVIILGNLAIRLSLFTHFDFDPVLSHHIATYHTHSFLLR